MFGIPLTQHNLHVWLGNSAALEKPDGDGNVRELRAGRLGGARGTTRRGEREAGEGAGDLEVGPAGETDLCCGHAWRLLGTGLPRPSYSSLAGLTNYSLRVGR